MQRQIGMHRACPNGQQHGDVMRVECLPGLHHQRHVAQPFAHHRLPHRRRGQQRRQRGAILADAPVREQNHVRPLAHHRRLGSDLRQRLPGSRNPFRCRECAIDALHAPQNPGEFLKLLGTDQRRAQHGIAQANFERHHLRLAQRIDRRIGDLREALLAVIPQRAMQT
jgi:hypothetical protein